MTTYPPQRSSVKPHPTRAAPCLSYARPNAAIGALAKALVSSFWLVLFVAAAGVGDRAAWAADMVQVTDARLGEHPGKTRFVVEVSGDIDYRIFTLTEPYRVVVDLPNVEWKLPYESGALSVGPIATVRYNQFRSTTARLVLDLLQPLTVEKSFILPSADGTGRRLVIDLKESTPEEFAAEAGWPEDLSAAAGIEMGRWAGGGNFVDINNDGWQDLVVANGFLTGDEQGGDL